MTTRKSILTPQLFKNIGRIVLGAFILGAGISHLSFSRQEFQAQVPPWLPIDADTVVIMSGIVEIILGASLIALPKYKVTIGGSLQHSL